MVPGRTDRRLPGIPVAATLGGRKVTEAELDKLAALYTEKPELAIARLAELGKLPSWVPITLVPRDALQKGAIANPAAALAAGSLVETVANYAARWIDDIDKREYSAIDAYTTAVVNYITPKLGEKPIVSLSIEDVRAFSHFLREKVREKKLAETTAVRY